MKMKRTSVFAFFTALIAIVLFILNKNNKQKSEQIARIDSLSVNCYQRVTHQIRDKDFEIGLTTFFVLTDHIDSTIKLISEIEPPSYYFDSLRNLKGQLEKYGNLVFQGGYKEVLTNMTEEFYQNFTHTGDELRYFLIPELNSRFTEFVLHRAEEREELMLIKKKVEEDKRRESELAEQAATQTRQVSSQNSGDSYSQYPLPWKESFSAEFTALSRALAGSGVRGCGEFYIRPTKSTKRDLLIGEYLVACTSDGSTFKFYIVWLNNDPFNNSLSYDVMGPYHDAGISRP